MAPAAVVFEETRFPIVIPAKEHISHTVKQVKADLEDDWQHGQTTGKSLIYEALNARIKDVDGNSCESGEDDAFFVADLGQIYRQNMRWKKLLPRVEPHYAVKCNPDMPIIRLLAAMGVGFDCASKTEIDTVLGLGVDPSRIIYAQPCKTRSFLRHAARNNVSQMTFDNTDELHKIASIYSDAELFLRIATDDSSAHCRLSAKFGATLDNVPELLATASGLGLNVVGVSFHVGSGASDPNSIVTAVREARAVFDAAKKFGFKMHTLDVGGGFVPDIFHAFSSALTSALDSYFPSPDIRVIAEPGRYYVRDAYVLACNVIARRSVTDHATGAQSYMLYMNDGVYGNFNGILFDGYKPAPHVLYAQSNEVTKPIEYSIWGPTCDSLDRITENPIVLNTNLQIGDWLLFEQMGAYSLAIATRFNGFKNDHEIIYVCSEPAAQAMFNA